MPWNAPPDPGSGAPAGSSSSAPGDAEAWAGRPPWARPDAEGSWPRPSWGEGGRPHGVRWFAVIVAGTVAFIVTSHFPE